MKTVVVLVVLFACIMLNVLFYGLNKMDSAHLMLSITRDCFHVIWGVAIAAVIMLPKSKETKANRYRVMCTFTDIDYVGGNDYTVWKDAQKRISDHLKDPECTSVLLVDTKKCVVSLLKGESIDLYRPGLDKTMPGWRLENA